LGVYNFAVLNRISVVIPSFNGRYALEKTLERLVTESPEAEVIVSDGGSKDGSQELVMDCFPRVRLLDVNNHGYAHNLNRGLEEARGDVLVMMNSDVLMPRATLLAMAERLMRVPWLGAVGPLPLRADGRKQFSFGIPYWPNWTQIDRPRQVTMLHGYCLATRRDVLETTGGLDERYFFYNEEYDWCWRLLKAGWTLEMLPETAVHFGGASTPSNTQIHIEARRGGMFVVNQHFPRLIAEATRRYFQLEGWIMSSLDARPEYREAWAELERMMKSKAYLDSPFPLSGRGPLMLKPREAQKVRIPERELEKTA
jgi:GT2 family glycosyltransferase